MAEEAVVGLGGNEGRLFVAAGHEFIQYNLRHDPMVPFDLLDAAAFCAGR